MSEQGKIERVENIGIEGIKAVLPHREPFLLIDTIVECELGKRTTALWHLTGEEYFFQGHFPQKPVLPGVLQLESLAQAGAYAVLAREGWAGKIVLFAKADKIRWRRQVVPGDVLTLEIEMTHLSAVGGKGKGRTHVADETACEAELMFVFAQD